MREGTDEAKKVINEGSMWHAVYRKRDAAAPAVHKDLAPFFA
jgi:hypothetical protein